MYNEADVYGVDEMIASNSFQELFNYIKTILEIKQKTNHYRANNFTVFSALRNETDEEKTHTTFLYEILRPNGQHGMKDAFLKDFFKTVLKVDSYNKTAKIFQECHIDSKDDNYGRLDLCIETDSARYPIEIKIYANDQDHQIERYHKFAKRKSNVSQVYYLTLNGHPPSEKSLGKLSENDVNCISFAKEIHAWLNNCIDIANHKHAQDVVAVINQYQTLLNKLTDEQQDDVYMDAIKKLICSSKENYECAVAFEKGLVSVRTEKLKELFEDIRKYLTDEPRLKKYFISSNDPDTAEYLEQCITDYYALNKNTWPKIWFEITRVNKIRIILNIELGVTLYYGVIFTNDDWEKIPIQQEELCKAFGHNCSCWTDSVNKHKGKDWWIWWRYLPFKDSPLNFRSCSGIYTNLYDRQEYKNILDAITKELGDNLESILKTGMPNIEQNL